MGAGRPPPGYRMGVIDGRRALVECMPDPRKLLAAYNRAAAELNAKGEKLLALWSPELLAKIGAHADPSPDIQHMLKESLAVRRLLERGRDEGREAQSHRFGIDECRESSNDAALLESFDAFGGRRAGDAEDFAEPGPAGAAIGLEQAESLDLDSSIG